MTPEGITRRLIAILSADVKDYTRLMSQDDVGTIRTLATYKGAMETLIRRYRGQVVDATGDNLLARFESVLDAMNAAAEMQRDLAERNAELPSHRRMEFRRGVSLGDVVEEEDRIYGDGVNIVRLRLTNVAARLQALAEGGGICVSSMVHDQVQDKLGFQYEDLGEQTLKNISCHSRKSKEGEWKGGEKLSPAHSYQVGLRPSQERRTKRTCGGTLVLALHNS